MKEALLDVEKAIESYSPNQVFFCPEESHFYSQCLEKLVFNRCTTDELVIEFGAGDGSPVIHALLKTQFKGKIHGYELNANACEIARSKIQQYRISSKYAVHNTCFFEGLRSVSASYLIANPPYIPALDSDIYMPSLYGGVDGAAITKKLLAMDCKNALLMISGYSNPEETIEYANQQGYKIVDFMVSPLQFGYYSSEPKVKNWIAELRKQRRAFYSQNIYFLAGALFKKQTATSEPDLSSELIKVMTLL
jgi:methylase of polypeptide subunit release factors